MKSLGNGGMIGFFWAIFWATIVISLIFLVKSRRRNMDRPKTPLEILKERYDKGEITKEDYERIKNKL